MDPVSRRLAAAAMGLAFGLSRDEELEKTRLDLERARMEREDFRNGAGPNTNFMHYTRDRRFWTKFEESYNYRMEGENLSMRQKEQLWEKIYGRLSRDFNEMSDELSSARTLLAKVAREHHHKKRKLDDPIVNEIVKHFRKADIDDLGVADFAEDDLGDVSLGLPVWIDEDSDSATSDE